MRSTSPAKCTSVSSQHAILLAKSLRLFVRAGGSPRLPLHALGKEPPRAPPPSPPCAVAPDATVSPHRGAPPRRDRTTGDRRGHDNVSAAILQQFLHSVLQGQQQAVHVGVEQLLPAFDIAIDNGRAVAKASIGNDNIELSPALHGLIHQFLYIHWFTHIARHDQWLLAPLACQPLRQCLQAVLAPREQRDTRPTLHQLLRDGLSNTATCTRYNRDFSSQIGRLSLLILHISSQMGTLQLLVHGLPFPPLHQRWRGGQGGEATRLLKRSPMYASLFRMRTCPHSKAPPTAFVAT